MSAGYGGIKTGDQWMSPADQEKKQMNDLQNKLNGHMTGPGYNQQVNGAQANYAGNPNFNNNQFSAPQQNFNNYQQPHQQYNHQGNNQFNQQQWRQPPPQPQSNGGFAQQQGFGNFGAPGQPQ